jgi:hypothetical protein
LFAVSTLAARLVGNRLLIPASSVRNRDSLLALLLRASLAGLLVGVIAAASSRLGPQFSGLLLAYPVGMTVIAASIHIRHGAPTVISTLYATALGTTSLATFCFLVAITASAFGPGVALTLGFGGCILLTTSLLATQR